MHRFNKYQPMKAEDLRIGNLYESVKWKKSVYCTMEDMFELVCRADGAEVDHIEIDTLFKPIPFSDDWKIKFFMERTENPGLGVFWYYQIFLDHYTAGGLCTQMKFSISEGTNKLFVNNSFIRTIDYVHEFQNIVHAITDSKAKYDLDKEEYKAPIDDLPF